MSNKLNIVVAYGNISFILFVLINLFMSLKSGESSWRSVIVVGVIYFFAVALMYYQKAMAIYLQAFAMLLVLITDMAAIYQVLMQHIMKTFFERSIIVGISLLNIIIIFSWIRAAYKYRKTQGVYYKQ